MGLPEINIVFQSKAETAIKRSANGIVALILRDATKGDITSYSYTNESEVVKSHWTTANYDYISKTFLGGPQRVIVERIGAEDTYDDALARLKNKKWNYLAIPSLADNEKDIADWIIAQRNAKKTFKAVLPYAANNEGIINFATDDIKVGTKVYTTAEYCCRIAGLLAGLPMTEGATYQTLAEVDSITESTTPDADIDGGKFILINDGEKVKVGRGVNSLVTLSGDKTEDMKKIKIIDSIDLIRDDIKTSFEENYINVVNSHENKMLFIGAINQYFKSLQSQGVLYDGADCKAYIDVESQREWLAQKYDVSGMTDSEIEVANTGSIIFAGADITIQDCIEDLSFKIGLE